MAEYFDLILFGIFLGGITGGIGIPFIIHRNKGKKYGKKKGFKHSIFLQPEADVEILENGRQEHSANHFQ